MSIRICEGDGATFLYESVSMRPVQTTAFEDSEEAEAFLSLAKRRGVAVGSADAAALERVQDELRALPKCRQCGERVVHAGERSDECLGCRPECEIDGCPDRGDEKVRRPGETANGYFCTAHASARRTVTRIGARP